MARFKLKRKSFGIPGALVGAKNWKAAWSGAKTLADGTTKNLGAGGRILEGFKGAGKTVGTVGLTGAAVAAPIAYTAGGGDFISGGEKSAKKMEFN